MQHTPSIKITLLGPLTEVTSQSVVDLHGDTVEELREDFLRRWPDAMRYQWKIAVNQSWAIAGQKVSPEDQIAFLPPFSGG